MLPGNMVQLWCGGYDISKHYVVALWMALSVCPPVGQDWNLKNLNRLPTKWLKTIVSISSDVIGYANLIGGSKTYVYDAFMLFPIHVRDLCPFHVWGEGATVLMFLHILACIPCKYSIKQIDMIFDYFIEEINIQCSPSGTLAMSSVNTRYQLICIDRTTIIPT